MEKTVEQASAEAAQTPELIVHAAQVLAGICDGAKKQDGLGYNGVDSRFMKELAQIENHSERQLRCMWHTLRKYRKQLEGAGIQYDAMVPPPAMAPRPRDTTGRFIQETPRVKIEWVETRFGRRIAVIFGYNPVLVEAVKSVKKSPKAPPWFDGEKKAWVLPADDLDLMEEVLGAIETQQETTVEIEVARDVQEATEKLRVDRQRAYEMSRAATADLDVPTKLPLYPFQKAGVQWTLEREGRALIGDEMGLGKTAQSLGFLMLGKDALPALVLCPATLRVNWVRDGIEKFTGLKSQIICSKTGLKAMQKLGVNAALAPEPGYDVYIVNYDLLETQTPDTWVKAYLKGDSSVRPLLIEAGQYAYKAISKGLKKARPPQFARLQGILRTIESKGNGANKKRFIKVFVNEVELPEFMKTGFQTLICDESHYLMHGKSQRTMAVLEISKRVKNALCMTGTPLLNRPKELWTQTQIVKPDLFPNFMTYAKQFCNAHQHKYGWDFSGASNLDELDRVLRSSIMIRRTKAQVLTELPPKTRITIPFALNGKLSKYNKDAAPILEDLAALKARREEWKAKLDGMDTDERRQYIAEHAEEASAANKLTGELIHKIEAVKQAALNAKFEDCVNFAVDLQEQQGKVIIFATHHDTIDRTVAALRQEGIKVDHIDGRVAQAKRPGIVDRFQNGDLQVLVGAIRAMAEGLTLTASHTVAFFEMDWNPGKHQQAEDRVHRISQKIAPTIYYLVGLGTIEEKIARLIDSKREVLNAAVGEGDRTLSEDGILDAILSEVLA